MRTTPTTTEIKRQPTTFTSSTPVTMSKSAAPKNTIKVPGMISGTGPQTLTSRSSSKNPHHHTTPMRTFIGLKAALNTKSTKEEVNELLHNSRMALKIWTIEASHTQVTNMKGIKREISSQVNIIIIHTENRLSRRLKRMSTSGNITTISIQEQNIVTQTSSQQAIKSQRIMILIVSLTNLGKIALIKRKKKLIRSMNQGKTLIFMKATEVSANMISLTNIESGSRDWKVSTLSQSRISQSIAKN
jgi:hypothetical protein